MMKKMLMIITGHLGPRPNPAIFRSTGSHRPALLGEEKSTATMRRIMWCITIRVDLFAHDEVFKKHCFTPKGKYDVYRERNTCPKSDKYSLAWCLKYGHHLFCSFSSNYSSTPVQTSVWGFGSCRTTRWWWREAFPLIFQGLSSLTSIISRSWVSSLINCNCVKICIILLLTQVLARRKTFSLRWGQTYGGIVEYITFLSKVEADLSTIAPSSKTQLSIAYIHKV